MSATYNKTANGSVTLFLPIVYNVHISTGICQVNWSTIQPLDDGRSLFFDVCLIVDIITGPGIIMNYQWTVKQQLVDDITRPGIIMDYQWTVQLIVVILTGSGIITDYEWVK